VTGKRAPLVAAGDRITVPEGDYQLGSGPLRMRVIHVVQRAGQDLRDLCWVQLMGVEINPDGTDGRHRTVVVRVSALAADRPSAG
jgi:hypothetical protein